MIEPCRHEWEIPTGSWFAERPCNLCDGPVWVHGPATGHRFHSEVLLCRLCRKWDNREIVVPDSPFRSGAEPSTAIKHRWHLDDMLTFGDILRERPEHFTLHPRDYFAISWNPVDEEWQVLDLESLSVVGIPRELLIAPYYEVLR